MWRRLLIAWAYLVALLCAAGTASAASSAPAKPHQGTSEFSAALNVCAFALATVEAHTGNTPVATTGTSDVPHAARGGSVGAMSAGEKLLNWAWKSKPTWRHTFLHHGQGAKITKSLADTARTGGPQGQWLNNEAAAQFLAAQRPYIQGPTSMSIPQGLGQVVMPNGSVVSATRATLVPSANGGFVTAYPIP